MAQATFRAGSPKMVDYTPASGNVAAGDVVLIGNTAGLTCGIAHRPIENGVLGALAVGYGEYEVVNLNNSADGAKVYWDAATEKVTSVSTNMALFGFIVPGTGGGGANSTARALHMPFV